MAGKYQSVEVIWTAETPYLRLTERTDEERFLPLREVADADIDPDALKEAAYLLCEAADHAARAQRGRERMVRNLKVAA